MYRSSDIGEIVEKSIEKADDSLVEDAKCNDQSAILQLTRIAQVLCSTEYDPNDIEPEIANQLDIDGNKDDTDKNKFRDFYIVNDNGDRLAFKNPRTDIIHICRNDRSPENWGRESDDSNSEFAWSACRSGFGRGRSNKNALYLDDKEIQDGSVTRGNDMIGEICDHCKESY